MIRFRDEPEEGVPIEMIEGWWYQFEKQVEGPFDRRVDAERALEKLEMPIFLMGVDGRSVKKYYRIMEGVVRVREDTKEILTFQVTNTDLITGGSDEGGLIPIPDTIIEGKGLKR